MVGYKIKHIIKKSDFSVKHVAKKIGMTHQNLYRLLKKESIESKHLERIAKLLDVPVGYFFNENNTGVDIDHKVTGDKSSASGDITINEGKKEIKHLKELLKAKDETIAALKGNQV